MNTARWIQSLVVTRPDLYRAVYDWNVYPHRWVLPSWLPEGSALPPTAMVLLESTARGRERLGKYFREALGLREMCWDFQDSRRRLALLSASGLERVARFAGAVLHAGRLARVVAREERRTLMGRIGNDAYEFGLRRGRYFGPSGVDAPASGALADDVENDGWAILGACLGGEAASVQARFRLKVPPAIALANEDAAADGVERAWRFVEPVAREALTQEEVACLG